jgi:hypothetical protein
MREKKVTQWKLSNYQYMIKIHRVASWNMKMTGKNNYFKRLYKVILVEKMKNM